MSVVALVRCGTYEMDEVRNAVRRAVDLAGGMQSFVQLGERVLLKANLLMRRKPDAAVTTHPAIVQALGEMVIAAGGTAIIGDSPGGYHFYTQSTLEAVYEATGMKQAAEQSGAALNYDTEAIDVAYPQGTKIKSIKTIKAVLDADKIINIPKVKTHMMAVYSGAVKNLFGIIPGSYKTEYHFRFEDIADFADVLVDICQFAEPALTVMDAVVGMEGYGPTNGSPRHVGAVLASADPYALDIAAAELIGLDPRKVPTTVRAHARGLGGAGLEAVELAGDPLEELRVPDFDKPTTSVAFNVYDWKLPQPLARFLNKRLKTRPRFDAAACRSCGVCARSCPPGAIDMQGGKPRLDVGKCISCFCCHELCAFHAVDIRRPWLLRVLLK